MNPPVSYFSHLPLPLLALLCHFTKQLEKEEWTLTSCLVLKGIWWPQVSQVNLGQGYELTSPFFISIQKHDCSVQPLSQEPREV